jgi:hypothetical protein
MRKGLLAIVAMAAVGCSGVATPKAVSGEPGSPAVGYDIHVQPSLRATVLRWSRSALR